MKIALHQTLAVLEEERSLTCSWCDRSALASASTRAGETSGEVLTGLRCAQSRLTREPIVAEDHVLPHADVLIPEEERDKRKRQQDGERRQDARIHSAKISQPCSEIATVENRSSDRAFLAQHNNDTRRAGGAPERGEEYTVAEVAA
ncbi:hypothetical protein VQ042_18040 [Aurantimonas sp. A2-1-M11]|uniref:hypothetical protein n=1 Tax=Aurantimonas sp. A2-1-M11 TaxID=3113712 RepID=UPI002F92308D